MKDFAGLAPKTWIWRVTKVKLLQCSSEPANASCINRFIFNHKLIQMFRVF